MRQDIKNALRGRRISFIGALRELKTLADSHLHPGEEVHDVAACYFGHKGRAALVATSERVLAVKNGWVFKASQGMGYKDVRSVELNTGLFFADIHFHGEGMQFSVRKVGRFAAAHYVKLVRQRIGSRYETWAASQTATGSFVTHQEAVHAAENMEALLKAADARAAHTESVPAPVTEAAPRTRPLNMGNLPY